MPRLRVIVLEQEDDRSYRFAMWADVPLERQPFYANPDAKSQWKDALVTDVTALATGAVVERIGRLVLPPGGTAANARQELQASWSAFQQEITNSNPWVRYGTTWDGTTWTQAGVA